MVGSRPQGGQAPEGGGEVGRWRGGVAEFGDLLGELFDLRLPQRGQAGLRSDGAGASSGKLQAAELGQPAGPRHGGPVGEGRHKGRIDADQPDRYAEFFP